MELEALRRNHWVSHLARHAHAQPDGVALRFEGSTTTWRALHDQVAALSGALARRGVGPGDRVAVALPNRPEFLESVLAANRLGAVAVPVNFRLTAPEVAYVLTDASPAAVVGDASTAAVLSAAREQAGSAAAVLLAEDWPALLAEPGEVPALADVPDDAPALIMYTSGTTGRPKGAVLSHANLQGQALTLVRAWQLFGEGVVNLCAVPMFHIGAIGSLVPLLLVGGTTVVLPSGAFDPGRVLELLETERVTCAFLVPTMWQALVEHPSLPSRDLSALTMISWGAAPASTSLLRRMSEALPGATNVAVFGQTEMSPVTCALDVRDALRKSGSVGRAVATVSVRVVDAEMRDVAPGEVGEIVYRGPTTMLGYWGRPEETAEAFRGGWFHSGDLVKVDEEGFVWVVDRVKDMIISGGENVYCAEVEDALAAHPDVREVAVVGRPHPRWGETPVAVVALREGVADLPVGELRDWARDRLAAYKLPTAVEVVDVLPRNPSGKVLKHVLRGAPAAG